MPQEIEYSEKYNDDEFEYRYVPLFLLFVLRDGSRPLAFRATFPDHAVSSPCFLHSSVT
jgi:hypothetical protein